MKQVPLVFVIMSGKKKGDYKAVLRNLVSALPFQPAVTKVTLDFERAVWAAFRDLLPDVTLKGCSFHWTQALWRKVRNEYIDMCNGQLSNQGIEKEILQSFYRSIIVQMMKKLTHKNTGCIFYV